MCDECTPTEIRLQSTTRETLLGYVHRGVELLDEKSPRWRNQITLSHLNMADSGVCILGQLYNWYDTGLAALEIPESDAYEYGFDSPPPGQWGHYAILTELWADQVGLAAKDANN